MTRVIYAKFGIRQEVTKTIQKSEEVNEGEQVSILALEENEVELGFLDHIEVGVSSMKEASGVLWRL